MQTTVASAGTWFLNHQLIRKITITGMVTTFPSSRPRVSLAAFLFALFFWTGRKKGKGNGRLHAGKIVGYAVHRERALYSSLRRRASAATTNGSMQSQTGGA